MRMFAVQGKKHKTPNQSTPVGGSRYYNPRKCSSKIPLNIAGCSRFERWPASGISSSFEPGMRACISAAVSGGVTLSSMPQTINVGQVISFSSSVESSRSAMARIASLISDGVWRTMLARVFSTSGSFDS